jgi:hypothetical protein
VQQPYYTPLTYHTPGLVWIQDRTRQPYPRRKRWRWSMPSVLGSGPQITIWDFSGACLVRGAGLVCLLETRE